MAELALNLALNPTSAAVLAATAAPGGGEAAVAGEAFAALLGRQISLAALTPGASLLPIAELLGEATPAPGAEALAPDLATLLGDPSSYAPLAIPVAAAVAAGSTTVTPADTADAGAGTAVSVGSGGSGSAAPGRRPAAVPVDATTSLPAGNDGSAGAAIAAAPLTVMAAVATAPLTAASERPQAEGAGDMPAPQVAHPGGSPSPSKATDAPALRVAAAVGTPSWGAELGQRLVWLATQDRGHAELTLTPPGLGRLEVTVTVQGAEANAHFVSASAPVREALEQALPRLREVLAQAGLSLGQASVNAESPRRDPEAPDFARGRPGTAGGLVAGGRTQALAPLRGGVGLIDTFA